MTSDVLQVLVEDHNAHALTLPEWQSHQRVRAIQIASVEDVDGRKYSYRITPVDKSIAPFEVERIYFHKHNPVAGGYYVVHPDGYKMAMTAEEFESNFSLCARAPIKAPEPAEAAKDYKVIPLDDRTRLQMALMLLQTGSPEQQVASLEFLHSHIEKARKGQLIFSS